MSEQSSGPEVMTEQERAELGQREQQDRIRKMAEEIRTLRLTQEQLSLDIAAKKAAASAKFSVGRILQSLAIPITALGVLASFLIGWSQLRESTRSRDDDRFDKAVTRLASDGVGERLSGVAGLRLFLACENRLFVGCENKGYQLPALQYLIDSLTVEKDVTVQNAILATLHDLPSMNVAQGALDGALSNAIEQNRAITASTITLLRAAQLDEASRQVNFFKYRAVTPQGYLAAAAKLSASGAPVAPGPQLRAMAHAIELLAGMRARALRNDYHGIFCEGCDFSENGGLAGARFDNAYLAGANFSGAELDGATFFDTDLSRTNFFNAHLRKAHIAPRLDVRNLQSPVLTCSDLRGATLYRLLIATISLDSVPPISSADLGDPRGLSWDPSKDVSMRVSWLALDDTMIDANTNLDGYAIDVGQRLADNDVSGGSNNANVQALIANIGQYANAFFYTDFPSGGETIWRDAADGVTTSEQVIGIEQSTSPRGLLNPVVSSGLELILRKVLSSPGWASVKTARHLTLAEGYSGPAYKFGDVYIVRNKCERHVASVPDNSGLSNSATLVASPMTSRPLSTDAAPASVQRPPPKQRHSGGR